MRPKSVAYRRVFNLGNYESVALEVVLELEDGDTADEAIAQAKEVVKRNAPKVKVSEKPDVT